VLLSVFSIVFIQTLSVKHLLVYSIRRSSEVDEIPRRTTSCASSGSKGALPSVLPDILSLHPRVFFYPARPRRYLGRSRRELIRSLDASLRAFSITVSSLLYYHRKSSTSYTIPRQSYCNYISRLPAIHNDLSTSKEYHLGGATPLPWREGK